jgi:hypothetical protein
LTSDSDQVAQRSAAVFALTSDADTTPGVSEREPVLSTFFTIDITIDPQGQPLAAYQFELSSKDATFTVVGVEAGEHPAFDHGRPPYFDPVAKQGEIDRLVLAEYALPTLAKDQLPTDTVRVATVHGMFSEAFDVENQPVIELKFTAAGNADGDRIDAEISHHFRTAERPQ